MKPDKRADSVSRASAPPAISEQQAFSADIGVLNACDAHGRNALFLAVMQGIPEIVDVLLERRIDCNGHDHLGRTPLHEAVGQNNLIIVSHLLDFGTDVNARTKLSQTPLAFAARFGFVDAAELLIERGADVNARDVYGRTPLHEAIDGNNPGMVHILIRHGADLTARNEHGQDAVTIAQLGGFGNIAEMIQRAAAARLRPVSPMPSPASRLPQPPAPTNPLPVAAPSTKTPVAPLPAPDSDTGIDRYFDAVLSALPGSIYLLRPDGAFAHVSQSAARRLGLSAADFIGKQWHEVPLPPEAIEPFEIKHQQVVNTGQPVRGGLRITRPQNCFWYDYMVAPIRDEQEKLVYVLVALQENPIRLELEERLTRAQYALHETEKKLSQNRTDRESLEHALRSAEVTERAFLEAGEPLVILDAHGMLLRVNHICEELCGLNMHDLRRRPFWEALVAPEHAVDAQKAIETALRGEPLAGCRFPMRNANGTRPHLEWTVTVLHTAAGQVEFLVLAGNVKKRTARKEEKGQEPETV